VGGGPGTYALWLAGLGYDAHLIDPVDHLVSQARERSAHAPRPIATCSVGDARNLRWSDSSVDVVIELEPLYHLINVEDRLLALRECFRVLRPGGLVAVAGISRFASLLDGLSRNLLDDPAFQRIVSADLENGIHRNETGRLDYFTTAKFHRPEELQDEVMKAGFTAVEIAGIEGPGWILPDFEERWRDPNRRLHLLEVARRTEAEPAVRGTSAHLFASGIKPLSDWQV